MMRFSLKLLLCLVVCNSFITGVVAESKTTGYAIIGLSEATASSDARLAQKVTYEARYVSVQRILEDLTALTGIRFYAGSNTYDWNVRSRKMNIFVKDVKVADLMNPIAHAMKFTWNCSASQGPPTYRLVVDGKFAVAADVQIALARTKYEGIWQKRRNEWIDAIMEYGQRTAHGSRAHAQQSIAFPVVRGYWDITCHSFLKGVQ